MSDAQLAIAWEAYGDEVMAMDSERRIGWRPWAYWRFVLGEGQPKRRDETIRLAELGELTETELATLAERANEAKLRVGTEREHYGGIGGRERPDQIAVELYEAVQEALKR